MSCQRCGSRCRGRHCKDCAMDLRYGDMAADRGQPRARPHEFRCLECGCEYLTVDDPCPRCGARHRRYIGPLPGERNQSDSSEDDSDGTPAVVVGGHGPTDTDEAAFEDRERGRDNRGDGS